MDQQPVETTLYSLEKSPPSPKQRRADERHVSLLRVGSLLVEGRRELCLIKNISVGGMLIRPYSHLAEGTRVSIELRQGEPVSGTARWTRGDNVGVEFDEPIDVIGLISTPDNGPRPRKPRIEVSCNGWLREDGYIHRIAVENVSQGGLKVLSTSELPVGADVVVSLSGLPASPGVIRWRSGDTYGVTFNRALSLPELVEWLKDQQQGPPTAV